MFSRAKDQKAFELGFWYRFVDILVKYILVSLNRKLLIVPSGV